MWVKGKDGWGKEFFRDIDGISRNGSALIYWRNGRMIDDSGHSYTEEEASKIYNRLIEIINPIDFDDILSNKKDSES